MSIINTPHKCPGSDSAALSASRSGGAGLHGRRQRGMASVELALVAGLLLYLMFAVVQFGWLLNNYAKVASATAAAASIFAAQVGADTPRTQTWNSFNDQLMAGMDNVITRANLTMVTAVGGTVCSTDSACKTALDTASKVVINAQGTNWADQRVTVAVTWAIANDPKTRIFTLGGLGLGGLVPAQRLFTASQRVTVAQ